MDVSHGFPLFGLLAFTLMLAAWLWKSLVNQRRLERRLTDLRHREQRLHQMVASLPDPTFAVDDQSRVILWNAALERLTGIPATAVLGKGTYEYALPFHGERRPVMIDLVNHWDDAIAGRYSNLLRLDDRLVAEIVTHTPPLDGRYLRIVAGPLRDEAGRIVGAIESIQDITSRRMSLKVLEGREELLRVLVGHMPLAVAMCDRQMKYLYYNRRWISDLGLPDANYIGRSHYDAMDTVPYHWRAQHARCLNGETIESQAEPFTRADGRVEWLKRIMHPWRTAEGGVGGIVFLKEVITAEKRAEQAAQEMDRRLQAIGNNLPGGVLFQQHIRPDGSRQFTYISQNIEKRHGVTAAAVMADASLFFQHVVPKDLERLARAEARASQTLAVLDETVQYYRKSGKTGWERIVAQPIVSADGGILFDGMLLDITTIKVAETNLRLMEHVLQNSPAVLFRWLPAENWPVDYVSENVNQFGHSAQALISGEITYTALVHPDDRSRVEREVRQYATVGTHHFQQEYRILTPSGETRWVDDRTVIERDQDGGITHFMGVVIDITDRKQAQQEIVRRRLFLESVLHHAPDAIITLDARNRVVDWNPGAQTLFGYTPAEAIGQSLADLVTHGDDELQSAITQNFQMAISGTRVEPTETVRYHKDGRAVDVIAAGSPIAIDGVLAGVVAMYTDITALKKAESELRRNERMLRLVLDTIPVRVFWKDRECRYMGCNRAFAEDAGFPNPAS
ncbi:PAS domain S-box protein [Desulfosarcina cetonica]|uniref:PAS domain S-box protein n=1 Tax=Desulfosarcina cetonica TaxID=90730 RepID=UPI0006D03920|nr:PAS domain S-box protein [Desulfosarcina cetonica]